jgi:hypothetical protein
VGHSEQEIYAGVSSVNWFVVGTAHATSWRQIARPSSAGEPLFLLEQQTYDSSGFLLRVFKELMLNLYSQFEPVRQRLRLSNR